LVYVSLDILSLFVRLTIQVLMEWAHSLPNLHLAHLSNSLSFIYHIIGT
jgi:hypothetical protein